jgi:histidyl-tRNA synthetase
MSGLIEPRTLRGFRDYLPAQMIPREQMLDKTRQVYRNYGYAPIDTPALEYAEILLGKGGDETDKQLYRFADQGGRDIALRFDLTVPLARFIALHATELGLPFKRYHVGPVWRGEKAQRGRYREFWQCDFDTIGTTSNAADIETAIVIHDLMQALGFERFTIRVNNRMLLNGLLEELGLSDKAKSLLIALDKLAKVGSEAVIQEMIDKSQVTSAHAERVLALAQSEGSNHEIIERIQGEFGNNSTAAEGIRRLRQLIEVATAAGVPAERIRLDLAIARGLDYYTGTIYETFLDDLPGIGSVCSGGRYDNLARLFTKQELPGVGASLGLDRLLAAMEELKLLPTAATPAPVFMVYFDAARLGAYQAMARVLRAEGIGVEVFPDPKKIGPQLQYAERRGFKIALIAGSSEFEQGVWKIKNLASRTETTVPSKEVGSQIRAMLSTNHHPPSTNH